MPQKKISTNSRKPLDTVSLTCNTLVVGKNEQNGGKMMTTKQRITEIALMALLMGIAVLLASGEAEAQTKPVCQIDDMIANGETMTVERFNSLDDVSRECLYNAGMTAPAGYQMAEDFSVVPDSYYEGTEDTPEFADSDQEENYYESIAKGCTLDNMFEDYSCKGPEYKGYEPINNTQQTTPSLAVPETDAAIELAKKLIEKGWYGIPGDGEERIYAPESAPSNAVGLYNPGCWDAGQFNATDGCLGVK